MPNMIDPVIRFIISQQEPDGSFPTYESYPVVNPAASWTKLPDPSPFITANILFSLTQLDDSRLNIPVQKAIQSLMVLKEGIGFWRFWPAKSRQHPVPLDMDDTSVVSFIMARCGHHFNNKRILLNNKNSDNYFETWLKPRLSNLVTSPLVTYNFLNDCLQALPTKRAGRLAFNDKEPAVAANVVLYLGENEETKSCIAQIITEVNSLVIPMQYYDDEIVVYYHIARAYINGVKSFGQLGQVMAARICARFNNAVLSDNEMLCAMAANVLLDYNLERALAERLIASITDGKSYPDKWLTHPYFCSNDRNFFAGSPALTAALFVEACSKLNPVNEVK